MFRPQSTNKTAIDTECDVAAIVYNPRESPDSLLMEFATDLAAKGVRIAGLIQSGRCHGDAGLNMITYPSGTMMRVSQDLGPASTSCSLDPARLADAAIEMRAALEAADADLIILNRFGKLEQQGRGLRQEIVGAIEADIPVLIAVPETCFDTWIRFTGGMSVKLPCRRESLEAWWRSVSMACTGASGSAGSTFCSHAK
ncbi:MAG: DUF2478 domain-containing protein [Hyphomicrobiaceae bacterium]